MKPLIIAMTGATGAIYGIRLLQVLRERAIEVHLVISPWAEKTITLETEYSLGKVRKLARRCYAVDDLSAPISSGSFPAAGMVIIPCSMKTLAGISHGFSENLIVRAADVMLKEEEKIDPGTPGESAESNPSAEYDPGCRSWGDHPSAYGRFLF